MSEKYQVKEKYEEILEGTKEFKYYYMDPSKLLKFLKEAIWSDRISESSHFYHEGKYNREGMEKNWQSSVSLKLYLLMPFLLFSPYFGGYTGFWCHKVSLAHGFHGFLDFYITDIAMVNVENN